MKKSKLTTKPVAPPVKTAAKPAAKPAAAKKKATPAAAPVEVKPAAAKPVAAKKAVTKKAVAPKKVATPAKPVPTAAPTKIVAKIDIGFGNTLFIRGEGPGLSWDSGLAMTPVAGDEWSVEITGAKAAVIFKLLVNDLSWSVGEDYTVAAGTSIEITPSF